MSSDRMTTGDRLVGLLTRRLGTLPPRLLRLLCGRPAVRLDGNELDPCIQFVLSTNRRRTRYGLAEPDPVTARARFLREMLVFTGPKTPVGAVTDFEMGCDDGPPLRVRHYAPDAAGGRAGSDLLVFLHGGGFVIGDLETDDEACRIICRHARTHVLSIDYRLAPEHPFPAALDDALRALRWAQENAARFGAHASRVAVGGESAGGNLSAVASLLAARAGRPPRAQMLVYPPADSYGPWRSWELFGQGFFLTSDDRDAFYRHYIAGTGVGDDDPRVSPLRAEDLTGLAPALVVTAGFDPLRDEGAAYADALLAAGNTVTKRCFPSLTHGFLNVTGICPAAKRAAVEIARDWRALLDAGGS